MRKEIDMNDENKILIQMLKNTLFYKENLKLTDVANACNIDISALSRFKHGETNTINKDKKRDLYNFLIKK